jgi:hypothetical protein
MAVDREYRIRIQTVGDASGAQAVTGALNESTAATGKGTAANKESGKSFIELAEHSKGFHKLLHAIMELSPAAGLGLIAAFSGPQAAIMGLIMLVRALKQGEEEAAKAAVEFAKEAGKGWGDIQGIINGVVDAVMKSDQAHADWAKHLGEDSKVISTQLDARIGKLKAEAAAVKEVISAMHDARLARLEDDKDKGLVTPEQYAARKAKIDADKRMGEGSVGATVSKAELAMVQEARDKALTQAEAAKAAERAAYDASEDPARKTSAAALKAKAEADAKAAAEAKDKVTKAGAERADASLPSNMQGVWDVVGMIGSLGMNSRMGQQMDAKALAQAQAAEDKAAKEYREREALAKRESNLAAQAEAEQNALNQKAAQARKEAEAAQSQADTLRQRASEMEGNSAAVKGIKDQGLIEMAGGRYNPASQRVLDEVRAMSGTAIGERMSGQDTAYFNNLLSAARTAHKEDLAKAVIAELKNMHVEESKKWQDLMEVIRQIRREKASVTHTLPGN